MIEQSRIYFELVASYRPQFEIILAEGLKKIEDEKLNDSSEWNFLRSSLQKEAKKEGLKMFLYLLERKANEK